MDRLRLYAMAVRWTWTAALARPRHQDQAQGDLPAADRSADGNIGYAHEMRHRHSQGSG